MSFCTNCGQQQPDNVKFCDNCGTPMREVGQIPMTIPGGTAQGTGGAFSPAGGPPSKPGKNLLPVWIAAGAACVLLVVGLLFYYMGNFAEPKVLQYIPADTEMVICMKPNYFQARNMNKLKETYLSIPAVKDAYDKLQDQIRKSEDIDYDQDIKPWLGKEGAIAITKLDSGDGIIMVEQTDKAKAQAFIDKATKKSETTQETYEGVNITASKYGGDSYAISGDYLIFSSDKNTLKKAIDRQKGDIKDNITENTEYESIIDNIPGSRSAFLYMKVPESVKRNSMYPSELRGFADQMRNIKSLGMSISFESNGISANYVVASTSVPTYYQKRSSTDDEMEAVLELLPDECIGFVHSPYFAGLLQEAIKSSEGSMDRDFRSIESATGINIQRDWLDNLRGDATLAVMPQHGDFFGDRSVPVSAAFAMGVKDQKQAASTMDKLTSTLKNDSSVSINQKNIKDYQIYDISKGSSGFSICLGEEQLLLGSSSQLTDLMMNNKNPLSESDNFEKAFDNFSGDMDPTFYINVPKALSLFEDSLSSYEKQDYQDNVRPWLIPIKSLSSADAAWDEKKGTMQGGIFLCIEK